MRPQKIKNQKSKIKNQSALRLFALMLCLLVPAWNVGPVKADKEVKPMEIVLQCIDAFFKNDDMKIRGFLTDNAQNTLANLATTDSAGYDVIRKVLLAGHPLTKLTEAGVKMDVVTGAGGERKVLLQSGSKYVGTITFRESTEETFSLIEIRVAQNEESAPLIFQVVLIKNKKKKDKPWQVAAFYQVAQGGYVDDYFNSDNLSGVRIASNEAAITQTLRTLQSSEARYMIGPGQGKYGTLEDLRRAGETTTQLESGKFRGYRIEVIVNNTNKPPSFSAFAVPAEYNKTGKRSFVIDESAVLHGADRHGDRSTPNDPVIPNPDDTSASD